MYLRVRTQNTERVENMSVKGSDFLRIDFIVGVLAVLYVGLVAGVPALGFFAEYFATPAAAATAAVGALTRWILEIRSRAAMVAHTAE